MPVKLQGTRAREQYPNGVHWRLHTVAETPTFSRQAEKLFNEDDRRKVINFLARNPLVGDEIPGTGEVGKLPSASHGKGKRGGARIIYYYLDEAMPAYALLAYAKSARTDLTPNERRAVSALAHALRSTRKERTT